MVDILNEIDFEFDQECDSSRLGFEQSFDLGWMDHDPVDSIERYLTESDCNYLSDSDVSFGERVSAMRRCSSSAEGSVCGSSGSSADSLFDDLDFEPCSPSCSVVTEDMLPLSDELVMDLDEPTQDQSDRFQPIVPPSTNVTTSSHFRPPRIVLLVPKVAPVRTQFYTLAECARRGIKVKLPKSPPKTLKRSRSQTTPNSQKKNNVADGVGSGHTAVKRSVSVSGNAVAPRDLDSVLTDTFLAQISGKFSGTKKGDLDLKMRDLKLLLPSFQKPHGLSSDLLTSHPCTECGKSHKNLTELRLCLRDHRNETNRHEVVRRRTCPTCNKICSSPVALRVHQMVHTGEKPYPCLETNCNRTFREKSALKKHYKRFHPDRIHAVPHFNK